MWSCVLALGLTLVFSAAARAQQAPPLRVAAEHVALQVAPVEGSLHLQVLRDDRVVHETPMPALRLDGERQQDFEVVQTEPLVLRNDAVELAVEVLGPRAVAATWAARDGGRHDYELHLLTNNQTRFYGTGERFHALDQRGYLLPMAVDDRYGSKGVGSYKPVPFVISSFGFGVWIDSFAPSTFDLNASDNNRTKLRVPDTRLRAVFVGGPDPADVLEGYTALTGRTPVPPPWAFSLWKSRDVHPNQDSVMVDLDKLRRFDIPSSVLVLDSPWETGYNDFVVNPQQFENPDAMFERIRERGFYPCMWLTPFINIRNIQDAPGIDVKTQTYDEAARRGYLVADADGDVLHSTWWKGEGALVDFTNPEAVDWWFEQLDKTRAYGARCFKADDGEGNFVPDAVFHDGTPAYRMKNRYSVLYDSVMQAYVDERLDGEGVLLARSGFTGAQRYPFLWAGDNRGTFSYSDGLPTVILAGQNAAMSGMPLWGSDIAGYAGTPTKEVFIRWTQFSAFTPFMQVHMTSNLGPWDFDRETLDIFRRYAGLHTELFPYLYEAVHEASRSGLPIIRPMALAFPGDAEAHRHVYQYLFGPDLLVAPMYRPGAHRSVYLPAGTWYDYWTGRRFEGPQTMEVEAPLETTPLFVRAGAVIPRLPPDVDTLIPRHADMDEDVVAIDDRRLLQVWPGANGRVHTWEGLEAAVTTRPDGTAELRLASETERPLELHLMHTRPETLEAPDASIRREADRTVLRYAALGAERTVRWRTP